MDKYKTHFLVSYRNTFRLKKHLNRCHEIIIQKSLIFKKVTFTNTKNKKIMNKETNNLFSKAFTTAQIPPKYKKIINSQTYSCKLFKIINLGVRKT